MILGVGFFLVIKIQDYIKNLDHYEFTTRNMKKMNDVYKKGLFFIHLGIETTHNIDSIHEKE